MKSKKYVKVKMLVNTAYQGPRKEGDIVLVPDDFASRWAKNGIAEIVDDVQEEETSNQEKQEEPVSEPVVEEPKQEEPVEEEPVEDVPDYSSMSAKDLYALCKEKGLDVEAKKSKEYYIEKLNA